MWGQCGGMLSHKILKLRGSEMPMSHSLGDFGKGQHQELLQASLQEDCQGSVIFQETCVFPTLF